MEVWVPFIPLLSTVQRKVVITIIINFSCVDLVKNILLKWTDEHQLQWKKIYKTGRNLNTLKAVIFGNNLILVENCPEGAWNFKFCKQDN